MWGLEQGEPPHVLNSLALDTGGLLILNANNIEHALQEIQADTSVYYLLAYYPRNAELDGQYRALQVRVTRPGIQVRARKGYLAR